MVSEFLSFLWASPVLPVIDVFRSCPIAIGHGTHLPKGVIVVEIGICIARSMIFYLFQATHVIIINLRFTILNLISIQRNRWTWSSLLTDRPVLGFNPHNAILSKD
jgi:hypothetical protein